MTVRIYKSTDAGAPSLTNVAGTLISLLNACLVTGYGSQAPLGWTMPYTGTNVAVFRQPVGLSNERYLKVEDSGQYARVYGFEDMSSLTVGSGQFPTNFQLNGGEFFGKTSGIAGPVPWFLLASEKIFYLVVYGNGNFIQNSSLAIPGLWFGDYISYVPNDKYNTVLIASYRTGGSGTSTYSNCYDLNNNYATLLGHYSPRNWTQIGSSVAVGKISDSAKCDNSSYLGSGGMAFPHPIDGSMRLGRIYITEQTNGQNIMRGYLPGLWNPLHQMFNNASEGDVFSNVLAYPDKTFEFRHVNYGGGTTQGGYFMEISNTW